MQWKDEDGQVIIDCISDLHGYYPELDGGDLLIIGGDLTKRDSILEYKQFFRWVKDQDYVKKIFIAGNHDNNLNKFFDNPEESKEMEYLMDSVTEFEGLKIWGSPWSLLFKGINPFCKAFTGTEAELARKFDQIPEDTDILITHSPPYGFLDICEGGHMCGCQWLHMLVMDVMRLPNLKLHIFGHIHEEGGKVENGRGVKFVNASHVNERYRPKNKPVRVIL